MDLGPDFLAAIDWATDRHRAQSRRGSAIPYISHPLAVAALVMEDGGDEITAVAAVLHDAVEKGADASVSETIRSRFGPDVADIVDACSDSAGPSTVAWADLKAAHVQRWRDEVVPERALAVAAADKLHNVRTLITALHLNGPSAWDAYSAEPAEVLGYYRDMVELLQEKLPGSRNVASLRTAVVELDLTASDTLSRRATV
jgi:(p)ppGpp synthase/HD superfamily hydrolase